ncbi:MAG: hypothetical protein KGV56_01680 [Gammaproteobacteria bacterium]|nr:hypothetical protein [Gammaproteobacteria bacterium]
MNINANINDKTINQTFYAPRFRQYALAQWREKKRAYCWHFAILIMIYFLILLMINNGYSTEEQCIVYYIGLVSTGFIFSLRYFSSLAKPESGLIELMQPVSTLEKWLLSVFIIMIAYPVIYSLLFVTMTVPVHWFTMATLSEYSDPSMYQLFIPLQDISKNITALGQIPLWALFLGCNSYALTTSIFFKRLPIIKSIALGFIIFLVFLLLAIAVEPDVDDLVKYWFDSKTYRLHTRAVILNILWWIVAPVLMFVASFFALKGRDLV